MNVVILGAGKIGSFVAQSLSIEKHDVILIDRDAKKLERALEICDIGTIEAEMPDSKLFKNLLENSPDLFFAATGDEETNLVACSIAKNLGFKKTICRVQSEEYFSRGSLDFGRLFFVDYFIGPEILTAQDLAKTIIHSQDLAAMHFAHGAVQMRTIEIPDWWDKGGIPIKNLSLPNDLIAACIRRKNNADEVTLIPNGSDHILPKDQITVLGSAKQMQNLSTIFSAKESDLRSCMIIGGTEIAVYLARSLTQQKIDVRIIDSDFHRCSWLAKKLPSNTIIHRDAGDLNLLRAEGVEDVDAFLTLTHSDEKNIMIAAMAKELGCKKCVAQITNTQLLPILEKLKIIPSLSPRVNVANRILSILDEETTINIGSIHFDAAKIVELKVASTSKIAGVPLSELNLPKGLLIAVIERHGAVMIGKGSHILCPDDTVVAICDPTQIPKLQEMFH